MDISGAPTSVFFRPLVRGGDGDGVEHAAVLPGVVGVADTLHLVTAGLRAGEEKRGKGERRGEDVVLLLTQLPTLRNKLKLTPWCEQILEEDEPGQKLRLKVLTGKQRRSRHIMLGPHGVPSST